MERSSGIIMHITSLPGKYGIGTLGDEAYKFVDFLEKSGQSYWQILPLVQTGYGDSPYQSCSAFSGNPYLIDLDILREEGFLSKEDYENVDFQDNIQEVNYGKIYENKFPVLRIAYENSKDKLTKEISDFSKKESSWINDYALFMAIKSQNNYSSWLSFEDKLKNRDPKELEKYRDELKEEIGYWVFIQYEFSKQWQKLKNYANSKGIKIIGDLPIYMAEDSVDVWANPENFLLDKDLKPLKVAGCPPDAFSKTGQLWGNPIYDWDYQKKDGYKWWINRIEANLKLYDVIRIDHFRGFEAYYTIPYGAESAVNGKWVKGPNVSLFNAIKESLGNVEIIAEDLGYLTEELINFREATGYPGMKVLQFAFDTREESDYYPHNYNKNCVVYTGTHDNDTCMGWIDSTGEKEDVNQCKDYLKLTKEEGYNWGFIRGAWSSTASLSITLLQDFIGLGSESRMNMPSATGCWKWRVNKEMLTDELAEKIYHITKLYCRLAQNSSKKH